MSQPISLESCDASARHTRGLRKEAPHAQLNKPQNYYQHARREVLDLIPTSARYVLDVGCGNGVLGAAVKSTREALVHGVEVVEEVAQIAASRLDHVWIGSVESALPQVPDGQYDCIIVADVLEHLVDPLTVLAALRRKLAPGGVVVASIPNVQNWGVLRGLIEGRFEYAADGILDRTHLRFFTRRSVEELFWNAGFRIEVLGTTIRGPALPGALSTSWGRVGLDLGTLQRDAQTFQFLVRAHEPSPGRQPCVAIVVLNWNGCDDTMRCLASLARLEYANYEIVVIDNGSTDNSVKTIRSIYPCISVIETGNNLGYAGGNNVGIRWALERDAEYILLLNNDTIVATDFLSVLAKSAGRLPDNAIIGPAMLFADRPDTLWMLGGTWDRGSCSFKYQGAGKPLSQHANATYEVDYVVGCCLFAPRAVFERVGLFDENFFLHYEEIDFCSRALKCGHRCFVDTSARLWHRVAGSFGGDGSPMAEYFRTRNQLLWADHHLSKRERKEIRRRAWRRLLRIFWPESGPSPASAPSLRQAYWQTASWVRMLHRSISNARNRAFLLGIRDYCLKRYGDCPTEVRAMIVEAQRQ